MLLVNVIGCKSRFCLKRLISFFLSGRNLIDYDTKSFPESVSSPGHIAQSLDASGYMKILTRPGGMAVNFHYAIQINILHAASPLNPRTQGFAKAFQWLA
ncbi:hypothetical protein [Thiolapillus sp.]